MTQLNSSPIWSSKMADALEELAQDSLKATSDIKNLRASTYHGDSWMVSLGALCTFEGLGDLMPCLANMKTVG